MFIPLLVITALLASIWPGFCAMIICARFPALERRVVIAISAITSLTAFAAALLWLVVSAIAENRQMHELYGDKLPRDVLLNQDAYGIVGIAMVGIFGVAVMVGLPVAYWMVTRIKRIHLVRP